MSLSFFRYAFLYDPTILMNISGVSSRSHFMPSRYVLDICNIPLVLDARNPKSPEIKLLRQILAESKTEIVSVRALRCRLVYSGLL